MKKILILLTLLAFNIEALALDYNVYFRNYSKTSVRFKLAYGKSGCFINKDSFNNIILKAGDGSNPQVKQLKLRTDAHTGPCWLPKIRTIVNEKVFLRELTSEPQLGWFSFGVGNVDRGIKDHEEHYNSKKYGKIITFSHTNQKNIYIDIIDEDAPR